MATATQKSAPRVTSPAPRPRPASARAPERSSEREEHRAFPRAPIRVPFKVTIPGDKDDDTRFSATLQSANLSVSGVFLESTFFLRIGQEVHVEFEMPEEENPLVKARATIVRDQRDRDQSGFALRFNEFYEQTEATLAKVFLGERLRTFAGEYMKSRRAKEMRNELDRLTDALAAWELLKITAGHDVWQQ